MTDSQQSNDGHDTEREFYTLLAGASGDWKPPAVAEVHKDFFDATLGTQVGVTSEGVPTLVLTFTPEGLKMILDGARYWQDHNCPGSMELALFLLHMAAINLAPLLEQMPPEIQIMEPFKH